tara:strand:- start:7831 stop:8100 length:270 start_codon:yes stop_codon:yes gene_type:complete
MDSKSSQEIIDLIHQIDKRTAVMNNTLIILSKEQEEIKSCMRERLNEIDNRVRSLENWRVYTIAGAAALYFVVEKLLPLFIGIMGDGKS